MRLKVILYVESDDNTEAVLRAVEAEAESNKFEVLEAEAHPETGLNESDIALNLLLNFAGSIAATAAMMVAKSVINKIKMAHSAVKRGEVIPVPSSDAETDAN